jgi:penicillin amidase
MGHSIPQQVMEIGMHTPEIDVAGITMPGVFGMVIGVSKWGTWSSTTGNSDNTDTYIEILKPSQPTMYLFNGNWEEIEMIEETIYDEDGVPHNFEHYRTVHGPALLIEGAPIAISQRMTFWKKEADFIDCYMKIPECKNISDFEDAIKTCQCSFNFLWADRYGNIGYYHTGLYPIRSQKGVFGRRLDDTRFPLFGMGKEEWIGFLPFDELPQGINSQEGFYANWNNKPQPDWPYSESDVSWGEGWSVRMIQEHLDADTSISFQDMKDICREVSYYNTFWGESHEIRGVLFQPFIRDAIDNIGGIHFEVEEAIDNWDCCFIDRDGDSYYDSPATTIFIEWYPRINDAVFENELGGMGGSRALLLHIFQEDESPLQLQYGDYLDGVPRDELIIEILQDTIQELENRYQTSNISEWLTSIRETNFYELGLLNSEPMPYMDRGTYNQIVELPLWTNSDAQEFPIAENILPPGQCGFLNSTENTGNHVCDQLDLYTNWQFKSMLFNYDDIIAVAESIKTLQWIG